MDAFRPKLHFSPEKNWMNDPNGLCHVDGWYHMFYQYNPSSDQWGHIHWGHARSRDLLRWEELPVALIPDEAGGEQHCFSGSAVIVPGEAPRLYYTSIGFGDEAVYTHAEQKIARGSADLMDWPAERRRTFLRNSDHPADLGEVRDWRDPFVFRDHDTWIMLIGALVDKVGSVLLYSSDDLENWSFRHILFQLDEPGVILECPNICRIGNRHVLFYSPNDAVRYAVGNFTPDLRFEVINRGLLDHAGWQGYYAPQLLIESGRPPVLIGWATEMSRKDSDIISGYNGAMAFPRVLALDEDDHLLQDFHPVLERGRSVVSIGGNDVAGDCRLAIPGYPTTLEIEARYHPLIRTLPGTTSDESANLALAVEYAAGHIVTVELNLYNRQMIIRRGESSARGDIETSDIRAELPWLGHSGDIPDEIQIRILLDGSIVEIIVASRTAICTRVYPDHTGIRAIRLRHGGRCTLNAYLMK
jgi:beta-fructofuranosidase